MSRSLRSSGPLAAFLMLILLSGCGGEAEPVTPEAPADTARVAAISDADLPLDAEGPLVVYAGRDEGLVGPLVERFQEATGIEAEVRYADDAALLAMLADEGDGSPADVLWAGTPGALSAASERGLLTVLPDSLRVLPGAHVPASGEWVPVSVRVRVLAYDPARVEASTLPASVLDLPSVDALQGRLGWVPSASSFHDFVTALRLQGSDEAASDWVQAMKASGVNAYASASAMLSTLAAGGIDAALANHDDVLRQNAAGATLALHAFAPGDPGNLALPTGTGVLDTSRRQRAARRFVAFLLSPEAQAFFVETVREMPLTVGAPALEGFVPFETAVQLAPRIDAERFRNLGATQALLGAEGL